MSYPIVNGEKLFMQLTFLYFCENEYSKISKRFYYFPEPLEVLIYYFLTQIYYGIEYNKLDFFVENYKLNHHLEKTSHQDIKNCSVFWKNLLLSTKLDYSFIKTFEEYFDWADISKYHDFTFYEIEENLNSIHFESLIENKNLNKFIFFKYKCEFGPHMKYLNPLFAMTLDESFFIQNANKYQFNPYTLFKISYSFSYNFYETFENVLSWKKISMSNRVTNQFIERFSHKIKFTKLFRYNWKNDKITFEYLIKFANKINLDSLLDRTGFWGYCIQELHAIEITFIQAVIKFFSMVPDKSSKIKHFLKAAQTKGYFNSV